jgi:hypothetical protein
MLFTPRNQLAVAILCWLLCPATLYPQELLTIPSGGGVQSNGTLRMNATIGGPIAGRQSSGAMNIQAGFQGIDQFLPSPRCRNLTVQLSGGTATITPDEADAGSFDNVGVAQLSLSQNTFTNSDVGERTVVLTVTDFRGFSSTCTFTVTILPENVDTSSDVWVFLAP